MDTTEFDIDFLSQKLAENPQSPLFARLADLYLNRNQPNDALALCELGVQSYPMYAAGQIVLGKCYLALQEYSKARNAFQQAILLSPYNRVAKKLFHDVSQQNDEPIRVTDSDYFTEATSTEQTHEQEISRVPDTFAIDDAELNFAQTAEPVQEKRTIEQSESVVDEFTQSLRMQNLEAPMLDTSTFASSEMAPQELPYIQPTISSEDVDTESSSAFPSLETYINEQSSSIQSTISLDEYISQSHQSSQSNQFDDVETPLMNETEEMLQEPVSNLDALAEKLQNVQRIVPRETNEPEQPAPTSYDEPISDEPDIVTPTLAEIYASQGEYNAAIQAYEILMLSHPDDQEKFQQRIDEFQLKQMKKDGLV